MASFRFLDLPAEQRNMVYGFLIASLTPPHHDRLHVHIAYLMDSDSRMISPLGYALAINRQTRGELMAVLHYHAAFEHYVAPAQELSHNITDFVTEYARRDFSLLRPYAQSINQGLKSYRHVVIGVQGNVQGDDAEMWGLANGVHLPDVDMSLFWKELSEAIFIFVHNFKHRWPTHHGTKNKPSLTIDLNPFVEWRFATYEREENNRILGILRTILELTRRYADASCLDVTLLLSDLWTYPDYSAFKVAIANVARDLAVDVLYSM